MGRAGERQEGGDVQTRRLMAWGVHLYTASGLILLALSAGYLLDGRLEAALAAMLAAVAIDATDGMLARRVDVKRATPQFDGRRMDDVIDYTSYVFVPVLFLLRAQMLPQPAVLWACLPLISSVFGFGRVDAKLDEEGFFVGFPSYWNIVVFYAYMFAWPPAALAAFLFVLSVLVFVPTRYVYISRLRLLRHINYGVTALWAAVVLGVFRTSGDARHALLLTSLVFPLYYIVLSIILDRHARLSARREVRSSGAAGL